MRRALLCIGVFAVALVVDVIVDAKVPGLTAVIGFGGCALIVLVSKWLGKSLLQRPEAYYEQPTAVEGLDHG